MTDSPAVSEGDSDPSITFAAVGHALTCWEQMEQAMALLYTGFIGQYASIDALREFGVTYRKFTARRIAAAEAGERFYISRPNQRLEGETFSLLARAEDLSIERHRIAHGMLSPIPSYRPANADADGYVYPVMEYWIGAPWYATGSLRTTFLWLGSNGINRLAVQFLLLRDDFNSLSAELWPSA